jgi:dihydropteroate synthase
MKMLRAGNKTLSLEVPLVMGILNCNNDSFYVESRSLISKEIQQKIDKMVNEGADIIDIGGMSTKPGSQLISVDEEISRISHALQYARDNYPTLWISIDTVQAAVADFAIQQGADMINDVSGGLMDQQMLSTVGLHNIPFVCTHMKGIPENMQNAPTYDDLMKEIIDYFVERMKACQDAGVQQVIIDPGFGFGKTMEHNFQILEQLEMLHALHLPVLTGVSRKSMIYNLLKISSDKALNGTTVLNTIALMKGSSLLRVHDVREARETVQLFLKMKRV